MLLGPVDIYECIQKWPYLNWHIKYIKQFCIKACRLLCCLRCFSSTTYSCGCVVLKISYLWHTACFCCYYYNVLVLELSCSSLSYIEGTFRSESVLAAYSYFHVCLSLSSIQLYYLCVLCLLETNDCILVLHVGVLNLYSANVPMWEHTRYGEFSLVWRCQRAYFVLPARLRY